jgi:putative FmdB family regulatory protein
MPTYEYICGACEVEFEKFQSITADPVKVCPSCGKRKVSRKIGTGAAIIFKGGGFYETDYRSDSYKKSAEADRAADKPAATGDSPTAPVAPTKADATPAATPAAAAAPPTPAPAPSPAKSDRQSKKSKSE